MDETIDKYETIVIASSFHTKLAGASFRQDAIRHLSPGQKLRLVRQPDNEYDTNAIAIFNGEEQLGYLNKELAAKLTPAIDSKAVNYDVYATEITGGVEDKPTRGVNLLLTNNDDWELVKSPLGGVARFNKDKHVYTTVDGKSMLSGSQFQKLHTQPFPELGEKYDKKAQQARDFGTSIHEAIELKGKYDMEASSLLMMPIIANLFDKLSAQCGNNSRGYEVFVVHDRLCGFIDMLEVVDSKRVNIWDWKIVNDLESKGAKMLSPYEDLKTKLEQYALQQNFYRFILESKGYTVENMRLASPRLELKEKEPLISWRFYDVPRIDITKEVEKWVQN